MSFATIVLVENLRVDKMGTKDGPNSGSPRDLHEAQEVDDATFLQSICSLKLLAFTFENTLSVWCPFMERSQQGEGEVPLDQGDFTPREYRDYSSEPMVAGLDVTRANTFSQPPTAHFPSQLHLMLTKSKAEGYSHICSWQPHGRAFLVRDRQLFVDRVLPLFFRQTKFSSFQRQLNLYGFIRMARRGEDYGSYYHEKFLRSRPDIAATMIRVKSIGSSERIFRNEPNFYDMEPVDDEPFSIQPRSGAFVANPTHTQLHSSLVTSAGAPKQDAAMSTSEYQNQGVFQEGTSLETVLRAMFPPRPIAPRPDPPPLADPLRSQSAKASDLSASIHCLQKMLPSVAGSISSAVSASECLLTLPHSDRSHEQVPVWQLGQSGKLEVTAMENEAAQEKSETSCISDSAERHKNRRRPGTDISPGHTSVKRTHFQELKAQDLHVDDHAHMAQFLDDVDLDSSDDEK